MFDSIARLRSPRMFALLGLLGLGSCDSGRPVGPGDDGEDDGGELGQLRSELVEGRHVTLIPWTGADTARKPGDPQVIQLLENGTTNNALSWIWAQCMYVDLQKLLYNGATHCSDLNTTCGGTALPQPMFPTAGGAVRDSFFAGCLGTYALSIAEATSTYYLGSLSGAGISTKAGGVVDFSIPPSSSSDRASWALLAVDFFRESAEAATLALSSNNCNPANMRLTCDPAADGTPVIRDWGEALTLQLSESMTNAVEASEKAAKYLHASAQAKHATESDRPKARQTSWRDPYDSLLRAASAYVYIPSALYDALDGDGKVTNPGNYPVVSHLSVTDADRRAEDLLRRHQMYTHITGTRPLKVIADRLYASIKLENPGAFSDTVDGLTYLSSIGIASEDFERACWRIYEEATVLGRSVVWKAGKADDGMFRVSGNDKMSTPVNPWYLYSITETSAYTGRGEFTFTDPVKDIGYARGGIYHAMEYFIAQAAAIKLKWLSATATAANATTAKAGARIDAAYAYARGQVQGRLHVGTCDKNCTTTVDLGVGLDGAYVEIVMAEDNLSDVKVNAEGGENTYDIWIDEEGLECALYGYDRFGDGCDPAFHKFVETTTSVTDTSTTWQRFDLSPKWGPQRVKTAGAPPYNPYQSGTSAAFPTFYITRVFRGHNELVAGLQLRAPSAGGWGTMRMPVSSGMATALSQTLGVDPLQPDETAQLCGKNGLARNVKVGLEDELLQAQGVNGSNSVEESWSYYLGLAKAAAEEADMIGTELVDKGLDMDMLAEDARADLEDQCGGTINIGDLRDQVCAPAYNCDLKKFLADPANATTESLQQLKQCLGIDKPVDAVLGSSAACLWQMDGLAPCECPKIDTDHQYTSGFAAVAGVVAGQASLSCPGRPLQAGETDPKGNSPTQLCPAPLMKGSKASIAECEKLFRAPYGGPASDLQAGYTVFPKYVKVRPFGRPLGLVPKITPNAPPEDYSCEALAEVRNGSRPITDLPDEVWKWNQKKIAALAATLGVTRSDLNFVTITKDGVPWLSTGKASTAPDVNPWLAKDDAFPCAPVKGIDCTGPNADSLLCISDCKNGSSGDVQMAIGRNKVGERLARAVELLRILGGAGLDGVEVATYPLLPPSVELHDPVAKQSWFKKMVSSVAVLPMVIPDPATLTTLAAGYGIAAANLVDSNDNYNPWYIKSGQPRQVVAGLHSLKATTASLASHAACDLPRAMWEGLDNVPDCIDRVPGADDSRNKNWATTPDEFLYDSMFLVTTQKLQKGSVKKVGDRADARLVCYDTLSTANHPTPLQQQSSMRWLPPACIGDATDQTPLANYAKKWLWFMDAGDIQSWPVASSLDLAKFWAPNHFQLALGMSIDRNTNVAYDADPLGRLARNRLTYDATTTGGKPLGTKSEFINRQWPALHNYTGTDLLDALELGCFASNTPPEFEPDCEDPGLATSSRITGVSDLSRAKGIVKCRAQQIRKATASVLLADAPAALVSQVAAGGIASIYPKFGGQYAVTVNELYGALMRISSHMTDLSEETNSAAYALEGIKLDLEAEKYMRQTEVENAAKELGALHDQCTMATTHAVFSLASAAGSGAGLNSIYSSGPVVQAHVAAAGEMVNAIQACGSDAAQAAHERVKLALGGKVSRTRVGKIILDGADAILKHQASVERTWTGLKTAFGDAQAALAKLASQRESAYRAAAKMLMLDNSGVGDDFKSNTAMRARLNTLRVRYERAHDYAIRMTYLARRSIEQKIGMELSTLTQDVGWVPAPQTWADTICSLQGIDYSKITDAKTQSKLAAQTGQPFNYADQYVGEYVRRLQEFMTAYVNTYVSHDGNDVALVSVRDELLGLHADNCDVAGQNELLQSYLAKEGAPLGASAGVKASFSALPVWERTCDQTGMCVNVAAANASEDDPLVPYGPDAMGHDVPASTQDAAGNDLALSARVVAQDAPTFGVLGDVVQAVRLVSTPAGGTGGAATPPVGGAPAQPPAGMVYWYRADACNPASSSVCTDLSGNNRHTPAASGGTVTLLPSGIGGRSTLSFAQNSRVPTTATTAAEYTEFTLSTVVRASTSGYAYSWQYSITRADGRVSQDYLLLSNGWHILVSNQDVRSNAGPAVQIQVAGRTPPVGLITDGDIVTVRGGAQGVELYVNGVLRGKTLRPVAPFNLRGDLLWANGGPAQWAESMAYGTRLSDADLATLHAYLAGRYGKNLKAPASWLSADVMQEIRTTGTSVSTGYPGTAPFATSPMIDAATGNPIKNYNTVSLLQQPLVPFSGGRYAFDFHSSQIVGPNALSYVTDTVANVGTRVEDLANGEYSVTVVANADPGNAGRLASLGHWLPNNVASGLLSLDVECSSGIVQVSGNGTVARGTAAHAINCGTSFVATLRGSESRGTTDIFVNGVLAFSEPTYVRTNGSLWIGGYSGRYLNGTLADVQLHMNAMSDAELVALHAQLGARFGITTTQVAAAPGGGVADGTITPTPQYRQLVDLSGGNYLLSWYERARTGTTAPYLAPVVTDASTGTPVPLTQPASSPLTVGNDRWLANGWVRHWQTFSAAGVAYVGWNVPPSTGALTDGVVFAAPQLEHVDDQSSVAPSQFWPTDNDGLSPFGVCVDDAASTEDVAGIQMRKQAWGEGCEVYCPPGLGNSCADQAADPNQLPKRCFHELKFHISQDDIEKGKLIPQGGFAAGNFNYRWEQVAVNAVGTAIKDCANSQTASACYANNFLQYSLRHDGPFTVRNYLGRDYEAPLFPGRIQQSKALMAERYLTNPLSSADRSLLTDFWDYELVGRPLEGNYTLRIYDTDGLDWNKLEDIQLLMHYRYWTRLN